MSNIEILQEKKTTLTENRENVLVEIERLQAAVATYDGFIEEVDAQIAAIEFNQE
jgi:hypothetical protein